MWYDSLRYMVWPTPLVQFDIHKLLRGEAVSAHCVLVSWNYAWACVYACKCPALFFCANIKLHWKIRFFQTVIIERTTYSLRGIYRLKKAVASTLCSFPHASLQHIGTGRRDHRHYRHYIQIISHQYFVQIQVVADIVDAFKMEH